MLRRLMILAIVLVALAVILGVWRFTTTGALGPFGTAKEQAEGPPIPGARGRLAYVRDGDIWTYDLKAGLEQRLTKDGGARSPRLSPAGAWIAFERGGRLWVIRSDGSGLYAVPGGDQPQSAHWSPRGSRLAYTSSNGALSTLDVAQGERGQKVLVPAGSGAGPGLAWSSDGTRIAHERHQPLTETISSEGIWWVPINGRQALPVYVASGAFSLRLFGWTSADRYVLFWQSAPGSPPAVEGPPLFLSRSTSSQPVLVAPAALQHLDWIEPGPRDEAVAYVAGSGRAATAGKSLVLAQIDVVIGGRPVVRPAPIEDSPALAPGWPVWAPRGGLLAYSVGPSLAAADGDLAASLAKRRIWLVQPDGKQKRALLSEATVPAAVADERPIWARDGKTVVFARRVQPAQALRAKAPLANSIELWVSSVDGSVARRVVGGIADPGLGDQGYVNWQELFDYQRG
jgi:hypothetical protein